MTPTRTYELYIDGASRGNPGPASVGVVIRDSDEAPVKQFGKYLGHATNNVAEYLALIYALQEALRTGCPHHLVRRWSWMFGLAPRRDCRVSPFRHR